MSSENSQANDPAISELLDQFSHGNLRKQRALINSIESRASEISLLGEESLKSFDPCKYDWAAGWILQVLKRHEPGSLLIVNALKGDGWFNTPSAVGINYVEFQRSLLQENFEEADRFTSSTLRKLAGPQAEERGYVYFSEVASMPELDLITLDNLWLVYSQGRFGFSVQSRLLDTLGGRFDRLWPRIGWKNDGEWTRYPNSFDWSLAAPEGHMPLVNQLRGVRLIDALFKKVGNARQSLNEN